MLEDLDIFIPYGNRKNKTSFNETLAADAAKQDAKPVLPTVLHSCSVGGHLGYPMCGLKAETHHFRIGPVSVTGARKVRPTVTSKQRLSAATQDQTDKHRKSSDAMYK